MTKLKQREVGWLSYSHSSVLQSEMESHISEFPLIGHSASGRHGIWVLNVLLLMVAFNIMESVYSFSMLCLYGYDIKEIGSMKREISFVISILKQAFQIWLSVTNVISQYVHKGMASTMLFLSAFQNCIVFLVRKPDFKKQRKYSKKRNSNLPRKIGKCPVNDIKLTKL